jgi:glycosyltransferase involved in cell wall biosynthesis
LKNLAAQLGIAHRVRFTGFISDADVHGFFAASELLVHPALDEDFGLSIAEALTLGTPALAFAAHGPAAIIEDGSTGRLVPVGDQAALDTSLADLLSQPALLRAWGETARQRTPARFGIASLTPQVERIYAACLPARFREPCAATNN